jgi:hypothetical protein
MHGQGKYRPNVIGDMRLLPEDRLRVATIERESVLDRSA